MLNNSRINLSVYCKIDSIFTLKGETMPIQQELLEILACPKCKGDVVLNDSKNGLICSNCKLLYHIKDDIPVMLIDEAEKI